ncbi:hypothetical protein NXS19_004956 [Fusarium pseudograminearum]|nr:hypothetical protein NXS19_004956 [Fusarium pseudograminearum]
MVMTMFLLLILVPGLVLVQGLPLLTPSSSSSSSSSSSTTITIIITTTITAAITAAITFSGPGLFLPFEFPKLVLRCWVYSPSPSAKKRAARYCYACEKAFNYKNFADHQKVHKIEGDSGARVKPCKQCAAKFPDGCRVAKKPDEAGTYACARCLKSHKSCEYTALKRNIASWTGPCAGWAGRKHPKLIEHRRPWEL